MSFTDQKQRYAKDLYKQALDKWGLEAQVGMLIEECAELIKASHKAFMRNGSVLDFIEEVIDVEIMLEQMKIYFNNTKALNNMKEIKLKHLENLLENKK